jgi:hypothetical protein
VNKNTSGPESSQAAPHTPLLVGPNARNAHARNARAGNARYARAREDRAASGAQLYRLNMLGLLALRDRGGESILAAAAHRLLAQLKREGRW